MRKEGRTAVRGWIVPAVALVLLNASITFDNVWPTPWVAPGSTVSLELALCVLLLVWARRWAGSLARRVLPVVWVLLVAGRYLAVTAPGLYGREFNLYWDSQHLGAVAAMLARAAPWWLIAGAVAAAVLAVAAVAALARLAFAGIADAIDRPRTRRLLGASAAALVVLFAAQHVPGVPPIPPFAEPVLPAYARQVRYVAAMAMPGMLVPSLGASPRLDADLGGLDAADVLIVFVESYGAVAWEEPAVAHVLAASRAALEAAIRDTGRAVVSAYVDSPTFGASSWLAHLSLLSGVEVRDQYAYTALMASDRDTLVTAFSRQGYRTVAVMPGMRQPWPEGAFYGFDAIYGHDALEYEGPQFGWWTVPDQFTLARLDALERNRPGRPPLFAVFPTSQTHAPFGPIPPYVDWALALDPEAWDEEAVRRAQAAAPDLTDLRPSYARGMAYEYTVLAGYLRAHPDDDFVLVALGDHQPPAAVSGPDAPWHVPVHVIGRYGPVLDALERHGFAPGLTPRGPPAAPMHALAPMLLEAFAPG